MKIDLIRASLKDSKEIWEMQIKSFKELLDKYQDFETNPASEPILNIEIRLKQNFTFFYFICVDNKKVGAIRIIDYKEKYKEMIEADIIISATSAPHIVVEYDRFVPMMKTDKEYLFIDLAVPRDVDERLANFKNIEIHNLDDIWEVYNQNSINRDKLLENYSYLIEEQMEKLIKSLNYYKEEKTNTFFQNTIQQ